jgi:hypothetical protein
MKPREIITNTARGLAVGAGLAAIGYGAMVAYHRAMYGRVKGSAQAAEDSLIDNFIPEPEVVEHHQIAVNAPADVVLDTAKNLEVMNSPVIRAVFRLRELALGGEADTRPHPTRLLPQMQSIGWVVLAEIPGREIVFGSVTQSWQAAPAFRSIPAAEFRDFTEPGYVKIVWTLRVDPVGESRSVFHTETRVCTTDADARNRFRRYWSFVAPGVELIRLVMLQPLKHDAERRMVRRVA